MARMESPSTRECRRVLLYEILSSSGQVVKKERVDHDTPKMPVPNSIIFSQGTYVLNGRETPRKPFSSLVPQSPPAVVTYLHILVEVCFTDRSDCTSKDLHPPRKQLFLNRSTCFSGEPSCRWMGVVLRAGSRMPMYPSLLVVTSLFSKIFISVMQSLCILLICLTWKVLASRVMIQPSPFPTSIWLPRGRREVRQDCGSLTFISSCRHLRSHCLMQESLPTVMSLLERMAREVSSERPWACTVVKSVIIQLYRRREDGGLMLF